MTDDPSLVFEPAHRAITDGHIEITEYFFSLRRSIQAKFRIGFSLECVAHQNQLSRNFLAESLQSYDQNWQYDFLSQAKICVKNPKTFSGDSFKLYRLALGSLFPAPQLNRYALNVHGVLNASRERSDWVSGRVQGCV